MRNDSPKLRNLLVSAAALGMMLLGARAPAAGGQAAAGPSATALSTSASPVQDAGGQTAKPTESGTTAPGTPTTDEGITEEQLGQMLVGKPLFLRGGYLANRLAFDAEGRLNGESPRGSYTLCAVEIEKVHLTKHKVELTGQRYGLHFYGVLASEDTGNAYDRVELTAGKQELNISIDRDEVEEAKKFGFLPFKLPGFGQRTEATPDKDTGAPATGTQAAPGNPQAVPGNNQAGSAAVTPGAAGMTQEKADQALKTALDRIFAPGIDSRLIASMPAFWQLYYQAAAAKTEYTPKDPAVQRQNTVDQKARLLTNFVPQSNDYAQSHAVSGIALYHVVVGADGRASEIAVARPIGFGLDENAVAGIGKASFQPAIKDGKAVPVLLNLVVEFRIYSDRTATTEKPAAAEPSGPILPGPYSVQH